MFVFVCRELLLQDVLKLKTKLQSSETEILNFLTEIIALRKTEITEVKILTTKVSHLREEKDALIRLTEKENLLERDEKEVLTTEVFLLKEEKDVKTNHQVQ